MRSVDHIIEKIFFCQMIRSVDQQIQSAVQVKSAEGHIRSAYIAPYAEDLILK